MYEQATIEPTLEELLADPIMQILMQVDGVEKDSLHPFFLPLSKFIAENA